MHSKNMKKEETEIKRFANFLEEFNGESDRGAALTAASYIEDCLDNILRKFLIDGKETEKLLNGYNAPLGTLSSKVSAAYSLGLIQDNEYEEVNIIRKALIGF